MGLAAVGALASTAAADPPTAPTPSAPMCGAEIASLQVQLVVDNATGTVLDYQYQLFSDVGLTLLVAEGNLVPPGAGAVTTWPVPVNLLENTRYFWRARARDPSMFGPFFAPACSFVVNTVNEPPGVPRISHPAFGGQVNTFTPTLGVDNATDPDQDVLRYQFELYRDPGLTVRLAQTPAGGVAEGAGGTTSWQVTNAAPPLVEDHFYYWRSRACDPDGLCGGWSATGQFFVTTTNSPPSPPSIVWPQNGTVIDSLRPSLTILNADDPDLDPLVYDWDLARDAQFTNILQSSSNDPPQGASSTAFQLGMDLSEDTRYCWRVRADDGQAQSNYNVACFLISERNDPPSVPTLNNPSDSGTTTATPVFSWAPSTDPEDEPITYEIEVYDSTRRLVGSVSGVSGTVTVIGPQLVEGGTYAWRARAIDRSGATSAFSPENPFTVDGAPPPDDGCCQSDGGCQTGGDPGGGATAGVGLGLAVLSLRRRSRRRAR